MGLRERLKLICVPVALLSYPLWFYAPVLKPSTNLRFGREPSDINFLIREAQSIATLSVQTGLQDWMNFPIKEHYWNNLSDLTNLGLTLPIFILTRFFDATLSINLYSMFGLVLTGIATFLVLKKLRCSLAVSISFAIVAQTLPWLRFNATFGVGNTYYAALPLFTILILISLRQEWNKKKVFVLLLYIVALGLANPYLFFFSLYIIAATLIWDIRVLVRSFLRFSYAKQTVVSFGVVLVGIGSIAVFLTLLKNSVSETGGPFGVYPLSIVQSDHLTLGSFLNPTYGHLLLRSHISWSAGDVPKYVGISVVSLVMAFLVSKARKWRHQAQFSFRTGLSTEISFLIYIAVMLWWLGMRNYVLPMGLEFPSMNSFARFVMPGIRKMVRTGPTIQVVLVVIAGYATNKIAAKLSRNDNKPGTQHLTRGLATILIALICVLDLNPTTYRFVHRDVEQLADANRVIGRSPVIDLRGPNSLISDDYILSPLWKNFADLFPIAIQGSRPLADFLYSKGIRFAIATPTTSGSAMMSYAIQDVGRAFLELDKKNFRPVTKTMVFNRTLNFESQTQEFVILRITPSITYTNLPTPISGQVLFNPPLEVDDPTLARTQTPINWAISPNVTVGFEKLDNSIDSTSQFSVIWTAKFIFPSTDASIEDLSIFVNNRKLNPSEYLLGENVSLHAKSSDRIELRYFGSCAQIANPGVLFEKTTCFGLKNYAVEVLPS